MRVVTAVTSILGSSRISFCKRGLKVVQLVESKRSATFSRNEDRIYFPEVIGANRVDPLDNYFKYKIIDIMAV